MCRWQRVIPRHKGSSRYRIAHGWKDEFGSFNLETLKFLTHFRELERWVWIFYFYIIHTHIYFFFLFSFFFLYTHFFLFPSFFLFFICSPWTLNCIVPTSSPMLRCLLVLGQRGDRDKVGTRNTFPLERYLAPSCNLPWIDDPSSMIGCGQGGKLKKRYFWF
jgi:hypothetical protein